MYWSHLNGVVWQVPLTVAEGSQLSAPPTWDTCPHARCWRLALFTPLLTLRCHCKHTICLCMLSGFTRIMLYELQLCPFCVTVVPGSDSCWRSTFSHAVCCMYCCCAQQELRRVWHVLRYRLSLLYGRKPQDAKLTVTTVTLTWFGNT